MDIFGHIINEEEIIGIGPLHYIRKPVLYGFEVYLINYLIAVVRDSEDGEVTDPDMKEYLEVKKRLETIQNTWEELAGTIMELEG